MRKILQFIVDFWLIILIAVIVIAYNLSPEKKDIIIVNQYLHEVVEVEKNDPRVKNIWDQGRLFIENKSSRTIYLESVEYSSSKSSYTPEVKNISTGIKPVKESIDYIFSDPPNTIRVKSGGKTRRWHLHR